MAMPGHYPARPQKFVLRMNFNYIDPREICKVLRKFTDAIDRTERMVGHKWPGHLSHSIHDSHAAKVGAWQITD